MTEAGKKQDSSADEPEAESSGKGHKQESESTSSSQGAHLHADLQNLPRRTFWINFYQAGLGMETLVFLLGGILGAGVGLLLGFSSLLPLLIMSFGFPWVFWSTVRKLAREDGMTNERWR